MTTSITNTAVGRTRLLSATDPADAHFWNSLVDSAAVPDVYYRAGYAIAYEAIGHGQAVAVLVDVGNVRALFPLLLRPLSALPFVSDETGFDAGTPYGYGGLLLLDGVESLDVRQSQQLLQALRDWCRENQILTAHVRLHPVLQQDAWFRGSLGDDFGLILLGPTIAIDLRQWNAASNSIATLGKGRRSDLNFARRHLHLTWTSQGRVLHDDLRTFYSLYEQRMTELEAGEYYHFGFEYYESLAAGLTHQLDTAIAWLNDQAVGAALFMTDKVISHYHLSASNNQGRAHKATTLILNGAAERARELGCDRMHLGGGARGEDNLFAFKQSFGGDVYRYSRLSLISDPLRYRRLVEKRLTSPDLPAVRNNFFPAYRG